MLFQNAYMRGLLVGLLKNTDLSGGEVTLSGELRAWNNGVPIKQAIKVLAAISEADLVEFQGDKIVFEYRYRNIVHSESINEFSEYYGYNNMIRTFVEIGPINKKISIYSIIKCLQCAKKRKEAGRKVIEEMENAAKSIK